MDQTSYAISRRYPGSFDQAIAAITKSLSQQGFGILTQIDVQTTLRKKLDVDFQKYVILGACNPPNAHKALQAEPEIGLLLPCNVIVYQKEDGQVMISAMKPTIALTISKNPKIAKIAQEVEVKITRALYNSSTNKGR